MTFEKQSSRGSRPGPFSVCCEYFLRHFFKVHIHSLGCVSINPKVLALYGRAEEI